MQLDCTRRLAGVVAFVLLGAIAPQAGAQPPGGAATLAAPAAAYGARVFAQPAPGLDRAAHRQFVLGSPLFHQPWPVPAGTQAAGAAQACVQCHRNDGRSAAVAQAWRPLHGRFADGTRYTLRAPVAPSPQMDSAARPLTRVAPQLVGLGLLDALSDEDILDNERAQALKPGPVKGRAQRVLEPFDGREAVGRFGWKAGAASMHHQVASALFHDLGVTSSAFPGPDGQAPMLDTGRFVQLLHYPFGLGVPPRRGVNDAQVRRGGRLFAQAQCAACHRPTYVTGKGWFPGLSRQTIHPYTDLLLHDMGPGLAAGPAEGRASERHWRTAPLWSVGLIPQANGHRDLLHDGRARGVLEAILWHGGEAAASRDAVLRMPRAERDALVRFVELL